MAIYIYIYIHVYIYIYIHVYIYPLACGLPATVPQLVTFGYLFALPGARLEGHLGTLGSHFADFGGPLDPSSAKKVN